VGFYVEVRGYEKLYSEICHGEFMLYRGKDKCKKYTINEDDIFTAVNKAIEQFESEFQHYFAVEAKVLCETP